MLRGEPGSGRKFSVFYFRQDKMIAVDAINSPQEFMIGKQIISKGLKVDKIMLADSSVSIRDLLQ